MLDMFDPRKLVQFIQDRGHYRLYLDHVYTTAVAFRFKGTCTYDGASRVVLARRRAGTSGSAVNRSKRKTRRTCTQ